MENQHDDLADNEAGDNTDNRSENPRCYEEPSEVDALLDSDVPALTVQHAVQKRRAPPIRQNNPAKKKKQDNNTTIITDEGAATAIEATTAVSTPTVSTPAVSIPNDQLIAEMQDILKEKEEFSLLAKRKIPGAANYERSMRSALLKIDEVNAKYQSFRITTSDSFAVLHARMADMVQQVYKQQQQAIATQEKAIYTLAQRHDAAADAETRHSNENAIAALTQRLDAVEAENRLLRARTDAQEEVNKDVGEAIRDLQHRMATFAGGA